MTEAARTPPGRLAENIAHFARALRTAGLKLGPGAVVEAVQALCLSGALGREDVYWTLHALFVKRPEDRALFDQAFRLFFRRRSLIEKMIAMLSPESPGVPEPAKKPEAAALRVSEAFKADVRERDEVTELIEFSAELTVSDREILKTRDFAQMTAPEIAEAKRLVAKLVLPADKAPTRRFRAAPQGGRPDMRQTLRRALRAGGNIIDIAARQRRQAHPPIVALVDISGSMAEYSRLILHFLHALAEQRGQERGHVRSFVFGTQLTNVTRLLRARDPDEALALCGNSAPDWEGGTRISTNLNMFNRHWSRRVMASSPVVLLFTDGLERHEEGQSDKALSFEMDRLHRSCRKLVWLNPLLRFQAFEARAAGIRAMLPHVDEFRTIHNLASMAALCAALDKTASQSANPRRWLSAA